MELKYRLIGLLLNAATWPMPVWQAGREPIEMNESFSVWTGKGCYLSLSWKLVQGLVSCYQQVFSEDQAWREEWGRVQVWGKIQADTASGLPFLVLWAPETKGRKEWASEVPVQGFSWGAVLPVWQVPERAARALGKRPDQLEGLTTTLANQGVKPQDPIVYFDEMGILRAFQRGPEPIRFLLRPGLELGWAAGVSRTLFWTTPQSKVFALSLFMGYIPIWSVDLEGKEIVFMLNDDFIPLLKITQQVSTAELIRILTVAAKVLGRSRQ